MCVSTLIITLNEEINLSNCLASLSWCEDIVVLDSYSSDRTEQVARDAGVRFFQRVFDDYASQRNYGLNQIDYRHPWVLMVDADEVVPQALANEINSVVKSSDENIALYFMRRKDFFLGKWIKHSSGYPTWFGRLARIGDVLVQRPINEQYYTSGRKGFLKKHLIHYPFNNGFHRWIEKHNQYSKMEANLLVNEKGKKMRWIDLYSRDPAIRRKTIKSLVYRLPCRPVFIFFILFIVRGGFLDGRAGLTYCLLKAYYEFIIDCKVKEIKIRQKGQPI
jgi:glycosyltransferase involved in cell wall biosynthesis